MKKSKTNSSLGISCDPAGLAPDRQRVGGAATDPLLGLVRPEPETSGESRRVALVFGPHGIDGTVTGIVPRDGGGGCAGGGDTQGGVAAEKPVSRTLRAELESSPLDAAFWLRAAAQVLEENPCELTESVMAMLATCSDQVNKSKVLGGKGLGPTDPLALVREKLSSIFGEA